MPGHPRTKTLRIPVRGCPDKLSKFGIQLYRRVAEGDGDGAHSIKVGVTPMDVSLEYDGIGSDGKRGGRIWSNPLRP